MRLTEEQRAIAEQAAALVPKALAAFRFRYPSLRTQLAVIDSVGVAHLAVCRAAATYDPAKSQVTTYFSTAIRNAILKEVDRERRFRYYSVERVPMELAEALAVAPGRYATRVQTAIARLPAKSRRLVHLRFYKALSLREIGEQVGADPRTVSLRLTNALKTLRSLLQNEPLLP